MATAKLLYRRLDALFGALKTKRAQPKVLEAFLEDGFTSLRDDLRLRGGLLYAERRDGFAFVKAVGEVAGTPPDLLDCDQPPISELVRHLVYIYDPATGARPPLSLGPSAVAGLLVGPRPSRYVLFFLLADGWQREELDFALNTIRSALGTRLVDARVRGSFREAAEIQQSLLEDPPVFPGYALACRSVAAEEVGGDFYDFYDFGDGVLGLSIGDASGHGLPAALLVRDVVTGLRMGIERELKITHVFAKLNDVIHRSRLSSRFVSVFYGEIDADGGNIVYVNAGHQPPLLFFREPRPGGPCEAELSVGGTVIGPLPEPRFKRGFARIEPGELLVACTDGILERRDRKGEFFGVDRLRAAVREMQHASAQQVLDRVFDASFSWGDERPWEDDATLVVLKRL